MVESINCIIEVSSFIKTVRELATESENKNKRHKIAIQNLRASNKKEIVQPLSINKSVVKINTVYLEINDDIVISLSSGYTFKVFKLSKSYPSVLCCFHKINRGISSNEIATILGYKNSNSVNKAISNVLSWGTKKKPPKEVVLIKKEGI